MLIFILILVVIIFFFVLYKKKSLKIPNVFLCTGAVKTGKSFVSVRLAIKMYRKALFKYYVKTKLFFKKIEKPMLYSNIHLRYVRYNLITQDIILRTKRVPYGSICFIDEASLLADSMCYKNEVTNEEINLFLKLFGHETKGGYLIMNTQAIGDLHYGIKRCVNSYLWIHSKLKLPFVTRLKVRELIYSDDSTTSVNVAANDVEDDLKTLWILNKYYKYYDCFCYSIFTDDLPVYVDYENKKNLKNDSLKTNKILSFRKFKSNCMKGVNDES